MRRAWIAGCLVAAACGKGDGGNTGGGTGGSAAPTSARAPAPQGQLWVRKGNVVASVGHQQMTPRTEDAVKTRCLTTLLGEVLAK